MSEIKDRLKRLVDTSDRNDRYREVVFDELRRKYEETRPITRNQKGESEKPDH